MAEQETKYFTVKNTSVRLVNFGGLLIKPEEVVLLVDDELGLNKANVEVDPYLEESDEDVTNPVEVVEEKPKVAAKKAGKAEVKTATGATWGSK